MIRRQRWFGRFDPGVLVVLAIALIAIWPFIGRASLPQETDAELHIFRLQELSYLIRGGEIYPRWAPNFYHGYGYPIFNYYAPLTYYLGLVVELMPRLGPVEGVKAVFVLGLLVAALAMYGFVRDNWGRPAGYVAAATYLYAPYVQYIDPHARGVLAESFSLATFPLALWALDRLRRNASPWAWLAAVLAVAAVILSHNLMALLFFGLLLAWAIWQQALRSSLPAPRSWPLLALFLGLGLAAFFWLPVILERDAVNLTSVIGHGDNYDFRSHFLSWRELLAFSGRLDWGASEPAFHFNLGVAQWLLGGLGVLMLLSTFISVLLSRRGQIDNLSYRRWYLPQVRHPFHGAFFALALLVLLFLMLPTSTILWDSLPFLPFFQFPWRLLGATAAVLAVLAGVGVSALVGRQESRPSFATTILVALAIILGLPLSQPAPWPDFGPVTMLRMSEIEWKGRWLGTTSTADFVPATVDIIPGRQGSVVAGFYEGTALDRVNHLTLPEGATVATEAVRPLLTRYYVDTPKDTPLRLYQFDFPGWVVRIDGQVVETELGRPEGFIVIPVPAGQHVVEVEFGSTPVRTMAAAVSWLSLALALLVAWRLAAGKRQAAHNKPTTQSDPPRPLAHSLTRLLAHCSLRVAPVDLAVLGTVLAITAVHLLVLQPLGWLHDDSSGYTAEPAGVDVFADFGGQVALIGYTAPAMQARPGGTIDVTLYWKAQQPLDINYQVFLHVLRPDGTLVTQSHKLNPGEFPTRRWPLDRYVWDRHRLWLPAAMPPGEYRIVTGLWVQTEGWRLPLMDESGKQVGDNYALFELVVID